MKLFLILFLFQRLALVYIFRMSLLLCQYIEKEIEFVHHSHLRLFH